MWDNSFGKKIAHYLDLMATMPNRRADSEFSGVTVFDGGKQIVVTGTTIFEFSDGAKARYGTYFEFELTIELATGEKINIQVTPKACHNCGASLWLGEIKDYCNRCDI